MILLNRLASEFLCGVVFCALFETVNICSYFPKHLIPCFLKITVVN